MKQPATTKPAPAADGISAMHQIRGNQIITIGLAIAVFAGAFGIGLAGVTAVESIIGGDNESAASGAATPSSDTVFNAANPTPTYQSACSMFSSCGDIPPQPTITPRPSPTPSVLPSRVETCPITAGFTTASAC